MLIVASPDPYESRAIIEQAKSLNASIVVVVRTQGESERDYLELAHDAPRPVAARLVRLSDPERALRYSGSRSSEDGLVVLSGFAPLRVVPYEEQRTPYLLLRTVRGEAEDWIDPALADDGARSTVIAEDPPEGFTLVRVEPTPAN